MKAILVAFVLAGCAYPLNMVVDTKSTTRMDRILWAEAAERIHKASGVELNLAEGRCRAETPACIAMVDGYEDKPRRQGEAVSIIVTGWATAKKGLSPAKLEHTMAHELLHALGVPHVTSDTLMFPYSNRRRQCISNAELKLLCTIRKCKWRKPECLTEDNWKVQL